ncbi:MAG TPA: hypothetical protein DEF47_24625 [Herpetosiphon sp.]|uniref:Uncharacterized protein n=1 Tax=Herpetosiphon aurantiacus (strain ATCC 23779 / DSM 785 / 114-95) TaxID=316274 RepID=A9AX69_HERA2|nr:hypothetical protein [Herpetosiphon sp.]ABX04877.1 hypothetical protein Haur_2237 [Herpetosiphon aurantiacus DSM 785]HBW53080.1 hypothetical protein [Herpetosiphon sp.]
MTYPLIKEYVFDLQQKLPSLHNIVLSHPDFMAAANDNHAIVRLPHGIQITKNLILTLNEPIDTYIIFRDLQQTFALFAVNSKTVLICYSDTSLRLGMLISDLIMSAREIRDLLTNGTSE